MRLVASIGLALVVGMVASGISYGANINVSNPANILSSSNIIVASSSSAGTTALIVNGMASDNAGDTDPFMFGNTDTSQRLSISGFSAPTGEQISTIRIFIATGTGNASRIPLGISVRSSSSLVSSLVSTDYSQNLGSFAQPWTYTSYASGDVPSSGRGYFDLVLAAPAPVGTQSLYLDFGSASNVNDHIGFNGDRIYELQVFTSAIPEPSGLALVGLGLLGAFVRRPRRA